MAATVCVELPELSLDVKENTDDIYKLLQEIKPEWKKNSIQFKSLSGGNSSFMYRCTDEDSGESITVRVKKADFEGMRDPAIERQACKALSAKGYFPPILAMFKNGFCYEYIKGKPAVLPDTKHVHIDEDQMRLIAEMMANFHSVIVPEFDYKKTPYFDYLSGLLDSVTPFFEGCPPMEVLQDEIRFVREVVDEAKSPFVLVHGDLHPANMVWDEEQRKITFVDWETAKVAPRGVDVAYFLHSFEYLNEVLSIPATKPPDCDRTFCEHYLRRWNEIHELPSPTKEEINQLMLEYKNYSLMVHLVWVLVVVKFSEKILKYGKLDSMWKLNYDRYIRAKDKLLGIKKFGRA